MTPRVFVALATLALLGSACRQPDNFPTIPAPTVTTSPTASGSAPRESPTPAVPPVSPKLQLVGTFNQPVFVTAPAGDPRLFVVERVGRILVLQDAKQKVFLDIRSKVLAGGERGLFMVAFAPDYAKSKLLYVHYTDVKGDTTVEEYKTSSDPDVAAPESARILLRQDQPFRNHNGGPLVFTPGGHLLLGLGDGGGSNDPANRAQNLSTLLGKLIRIDPRTRTQGKPYGIPADNPFLTMAGARPEIWAYGVRNPWRLSIAENGDLYIGDVGQFAIEEVNWVPPSAQRGANYGWKRYEGNRLNRNVKIDERQLVRPVVTYNHDSGACSVTGGYVYRGSVNTLEGYYLYGDYCAGFVKGFKIANGKAVDRKDFPELRTPGLSSFGEDGAGELYLISLNGEIYKIVPK